MLRVLVTLTCVCVGLSSQEVRDKAVSEEFRYYSQGYFQKVPLQINDTVDVRINALGEASSWVVGVLVNTEKPPHAVAGTGTLGRRRQGSDMRMVYEMRNQPVLVEQGAVRLDAERARMQGHFVYLVVAPGTRVRCWVDGRLAGEAAVSESWLIRDGKVVPGPVEGLQTVIARLGY